MRASPRSPRLPALIGAGILKWIVLVFSMLLFLFPALYVAARWFGVATVIVLEEPGVIGAFSRSAALSRGRKWHVLNTLGLIGIITLALAIGMMWLASLTGSAVVGVVLNGALGIVIYPVSGLVDVLLYYDTRIRDEGFDLEHMAHALDVDAVPAVAPAVAPAVVRVVVPAVAPAPQA